MSLLPAASAVTSLSRKASSGRGTKGNEGTEQQMKMKLEKEIPRKRTAAGVPYLRDVWRSSP
jgi:hypothetical protein